MLSRSSRGAAVTLFVGYELREIVSTDAIGAVVYRGYQRSVGREVAVRVIGADLANDPAFMARYQSDAARIAQLNHPNIVYIQDSWREVGRVYQVMQWIEGERLDEYLAAGHPPLSTALKSIGQLADALSAAHRADVVHGNLGGHSVLISDAGDSYLTDFVIGKEAGSQQADRRALAHVAHEMLCGEPPPLTERGYQPPGPDTLSPELAGVFEGAFNGGGFSRIDDFVRGVRQATGGDVIELAEELASTRSDLRNPYKGLQAFQLADAPDFFGREDLIDRLVEKLSSRRLVAVVGPSGSGKSSLVKAGLNARLGAGEQPMMLSEMYPGSHPFEELEGAMRQIAVNSVPMSDQLVANDRGLNRVLKSILPQDGTELVLVIDQFEELFSMVAAEPLRALFLDSLVTAITDSHSRLRVVVTMRADFFDRPLRYPEFGALVEAGLMPVTAPDDLSLAAAIEGPARAVGLAIEAGVVDEIIRDVSDQPGGLPLLQYALTDLFNRRSADVLTLAEYRSSGGVLGALAARAEELFGELSSDGRQAMHQAFLRLVTVDEGTDDVRRRVSRAELAALEVDRDALNEGLQRFGAHRLLTFDSDPVSRAPTVEVAHEALLREWERLRGWIDDQRDHLVSRRRLGAAVGEWQEAANDPAYLLTAGRLVQFDSWARSTDLALSRDERDFLQMSRERGAELVRVGGRSAATGNGLIACGRGGGVDVRAVRAAETQRGSGECLRDRDGAPRQRSGVRVRVESPASPADGSRDISA